MGVLSGTLRPMAFKNVKKPLFSAVFRRFLWDGCEIFSSIENFPFQNTPEQKFLHHYRAFAQMYYDKAYKFKIIERVLNDLAKKFSPSELKTLAKQVYLN